MTNHIHNWTNASIGIAGWNGKDGDQWFGQLKNGVWVFYSCRNG